MLAYNLTYNVMMALLTLLYICRRMCILSTVDCLYQGSMPEEAGCCCPTDAGFINVQGSRCLLSKNYDGEIGDSSRLLLTSVAARICRLREILVDC